MFTFITVKNTFNGNRIKEIGNSIETTKADKENHGFGLKNIKSIVEKYKGEIKYSTNSNEFVAEVRV